MRRIQLMTPVAVLMCSSIALAADIYVPLDYPTIQAAIDVAEQGDHVIVADGVYSGAGNINLDMNGKAITVRSENGPQGCTIDGTATPDEQAFIFASGESPLSRVEGFTIAGFTTNINHAGAIRCISSDPAIFGCVFLDNRTATGTEPTPPGSAMYLADSSAQARNCRFEGNIGAPIFIDAASVMYVVECTLENNLARSNGLNAGAAIESHGFMLVFDSFLIGNRIIAESGSARGGAIGHLGSLLDLTNNVFEANQAEGPSAQGSAVYARGDFVLNGGAFLANNGDHAGAAFALDAADAGESLTPFVSSTIFEDNRVGGLLIIDPAGMVDLRISGGEYCGNVPYHVSGPYRTQGLPVVCCPADVDDSGEVAFADLLAVLAAWGPCQECEADVDENGVVDFADLLSVLAQWGDCPQL